jgi:hypothetical protein
MGAANWIWIGSACGLVVVALGAVLAIRRRSS